jgi:hypothetical protein
MKPSSMVMLKMLAGKAKVPVAREPKVTLPKAAAAPQLKQPGPTETSSSMKPVNDPTDPNQLLESERTDTGAKPSKRIPVALGLPRNPIKTKG